MAAVVKYTSMDNHNGPSLYAFFRPKSSIVQSIDIEENGDENQKKRRRTASPIQCTSSYSSTTVDSWQDQLHVAAFGEHSDQGEQQEPAPNSATESAQHYLTKQEENMANEHQKTERASQVKNPSTPPKKMLKVRPDGKLVSPRPQDMASKSFRGAKKAISKMRAKEKHMIVVLKYGKNEMTQIFSSVNDKHSNELSMTKIAVAKIEPPKPTHPFFIDPLTRLSDKSRPATEDSITGSANHDNALRQREVKSTLEKPLTVYQDPGGARTSLGGFDARPPGQDKSRIRRFPGAIAPVFPPRGMVHIGHQVAPDSDLTTTPQISGVPRTSSRLKNAALHISEREEFLQVFAALVKSCRLEKNSLHNMADGGRASGRLPSRRVMTGSEAQQRVRESISCSLPTPGKAETLGLREEPCRDSLGSDHAPAHDALLHLYEKIATSLTAFDAFECETQDWAHKYAPKSADQVLQQGPEALHLRYWLKNLTVNSVEGSITGATKVQDPSKGPVPRKKRQKNSRGLEGFIVSSDEELDQMDELADPRLDGPGPQVRSSTKRSLLRNGDFLDFSTATGSSGRVSNAVVISGPHGCGKTAAVYAVAKELNFEVFEINAGSRRSGKDLLDKVGDMSRNHLVSLGPEKCEVGIGQSENTGESVLLVSDALKQDLESGRQGTVNSFFKPKPQSEKSKPKSHKKRAFPKSKEKPKKSPNHKQSVILLEEVDILFEEDRQFWATTLELVLQSKRPIIMTCTDESLLPLHHLPLHAILRFRPPSESLATDYLLLVACNEGHLLSREAVSALYNCKGNDLRASINELNFFCQMALGDTKGGLEWMLIRPSLRERQNDKEETMRVISEGTYLKGMGCAACKDKQLDSGGPIYERNGILGEISSGWSRDVQDWEELVTKNTLASKGQVERQEKLTTLENLDQALGALSTADIYPRYGVQYGSSAVLDPSQPRLTEKTRADFVEGSILLQAEPRSDPTNLAMSFASSVAFCTRNLLAQAKMSPSIAQSMEDYCTEIKYGKGRRLRGQDPITRSSLITTFSPIAHSPKSLSKGPYISSFDNTQSVIMEEVAPYVRSIVAYDMRLEEQRLRLNSLLSEGARNGKRIRTTRASRAALEGGSKASTRREKWFPGSTDFASVLLTGGSSWQRVALQRTATQCSEDDRSRDGSSQPSSVSAKDGAD